VKLGTSNNVLGSGSSSGGGGTSLSSGAIAAIAVGWALFGITAVILGVIIWKIHKNSGQSSGKKYQLTLNPPSRETIRYDAEADKSKKSINEDRSETPIPMPKIELPKIETD